jgi:Fur family transcriptional regulator, peroxide stress response regulator
MLTPADFRELCHRHNLAATHQRQVIYETIMALPGHPSPEDIYGRARKKIPSISLATVYKNIRTFLDSGVLREVSLHHGSLRVESNHHPHHHLVCINCKTIMDLDEAGLAPLRFRRKLPRGFQVKRIAVDILGICEACSSRGARKTRIT